MEFRILQVFIFALLFSNFAHMTRETLWNRESDYDNVIFTDDFLWEAETKSRIDCARWCAEDSDCASVTSTVLTSDSVTCRGHSKVMTSGGTAVAETRQYSRKNTGPPTYHLGSLWLTKACTVAEDCDRTGAECIEQQCLCTPGFYYSISQDACHVGCSRLQTDFVEYPGWLLGLNNMDEGTTTWEECRKWCFSTTRCVSLEYHFDQSVCYLSNVTVLDVSPMFWRKSDSNISYFQRACV
ncbi:uncharacterized protein LOC143286450 [Babylonia areolata]|uniref:uncharacterized protein LOC143286450 n=1 Tax=Babylonia areolata TaxID=304850 RepID=UPI003FD27971